CQAPFEDENLKRNPGLLKSPPPESWNCPPFQFPPCGGAVAVEVCSTLSERNAVGNSPALNVLGALHGPPLRSRYANGLAGNGPTMLDTDAARPSASVERVSITGAKPAAAPRTPNCPRSGPFVRQPARGRRSSRFA